MIKKVTARRPATRKSASQKAAARKAQANRGAIICDSDFCEALRRQRAAEEDTSGGFIDRKQAYKDRELIFRTKLLGRDQDVIDAAIRKGRQGGGFEPTTAAAAAKLIENFIAKAAIAGVDLTPEQRAKIINDVLETRLGGQFWMGKDRLPVGGRGTPEQKLKTKFDNDLLTRAGIPNGQITEREKILGGALPGDRSNRAGEVETLGGDKTNAADYLALEEFKGVSTRPGVSDSEIADAYNRFIKKVGDNATAREAAEIRAEERAWENTTDYSSGDTGSGDPSNSSEAPTPTVPEYQADPEPTPNPTPNPSPAPNPAPSEPASSSTQEPEPEPGAEESDKGKPEVKVTVTVTTPEDEVIIIDSEGNVIAGSEAEESSSGDSDEDKSKDNEEDKAKDDENKDAENKDDENKDDENKDDENSEENGSKPVNPNYDDGIVLNKKTDLEIWQERRDAQRGIQSSGRDSDLGASEALGRVEGTPPPQRQGPQIDYADQPRGQSGAYIDPFANRNPSGGIIGFESDSDSENNSDNDSESGNEYRPETPVQRTLVPASEDPKPKPETGEEKQSSDKNNK